MSTQPSPRPLPERPNLRHLKDQARDHAPPATGDHRRRSSTVGFTTLIGRPSAYATI